MTSTRALAVVAILSLLLLVAGVAVHGTPSERVWMLALAAGDAPVAVQMLWSSLTVAGFGWACIIVLLAADRRDGALVALMVPVLLLTGGVTHGLKRWLSTLRPAGSEIGAELAVIGERIQGLGSTPSGHALAAAATATLLVLWFGADPRRRLAAWAIALLGAAVAVSRVFVGAHWPSDVLIGAAVGLATVLLIVVLAAIGPFARAWRGLQGASATTRGQRWVAVLEVAAVAGLLITPTGYPLGWPMEVLLTVLGLGSALRRWQQARPTGGHRRTRASVPAGVNPASGAMPGSPGSPISTTSPGTPSAQERG